MVPAAFPAHFHDVAGKVALLTGEADQLGFLRYAPPVRGQATAENVGDVHERFTVADRTGFRGRFAEVFGSAQKFGVRIANVDAGEPTTFVLRNQVSPDEPKVNGTGARLPGSANVVGTK